jgi:4-hydroxythreonine-4-phosphate dehydrogenase
MPHPGQIEAAAGQVAFEAVEQSISAALAGQIDVLVTAPIQKEAFRLAQVPYLDHTAALAGLCRSDQAQTLFVTGNLRILFLTRHLPFREIAAHINRQDILSFVETAVKELSRIGLKEPSLALAALNPHGGDHGLMGDEEEQILRPAVDDLQSKGIRISGPVPADSVFHQAATGKYDAVISLYHDQGHIAAKTLDFYGTISLTLGLPFLRTSVDHGTAFDIAGKNMANEKSMVGAIRAAIDYRPGGK